MPDEKPPGAPMAIVSVPNLRDLVALPSRSGPALEFLGGGRAAQMLARGYRSIVTLPGARRLRGAVRRPRPSQGYCSNRKLATVSVRARTRAGLQVWMGDRR